MTLPWPWLWAIAVVAFAVGLLIWAAISIDNYWQGGGPKDT